VAGGELIAMKRNKILQYATKVASKSPFFLRKLIRKATIHIFSEEFETRINGSRFLFRPKIDGFWYLNYSDAEPGVKNILLENLNKGDIFIDVGAYIGYYSVIAANVVKDVGDSGKVVAFEVHPETYEMLKKNFAINEYKNCIAENIALSNEEGSFKLFTAKRGISSGSLFSVEGIHMASYITVKATTLDHYCENHNLAPNLVKMDVEGAEYIALLGMQKVIDLYHPKFIIELHPQHLEQQGISLQVLFDFLKKRGYQIGLIDESGVKSYPISELVTLCKVNTKNRYGSKISPHVFCTYAQQMDK
jgi:FkbM family methyltransferase